MNKNLRTESRCEYGWNGTHPSIHDLALGCLQRVADSLESLAGERLEAEIQKRVLAALEERRDRDQRFDERAAMRWLSRQPVKINDFGVSTIRAAEWYASCFQVPSTLGSITIWRSLANGECSAHGLGPVTRVRLGEWLDALEDAGVKP